MDETPLDRAIRLGGGVAGLAEKLGESKQTVSNWRGRGGAPANRCPAIEQLTGVSRQELRPNDWRDYWPELDAAPAPAAPEDIPAAGAPGPAAHVEHMKAA